MLGFDPRHVIRTEPKDATPNFEPNYLACIEFDMPDLPWLFTPAAPAGDRLRPWLALVVLKAGEFTPVQPPPQPLPAIDVTDLGALQPLDDAWNWAHTQVSGDAGLAATAEWRAGRRHFPADVPAAARPGDWLHGVPGAGVRGRPPGRAWPGCLRADQHRSRLDRRHPGTAAAAVLLQLRLPHQRPGRLRIAGPPPCPAQARRGHRPAADERGRPDGRFPVRRAAARAGRRADEPGHHGDALERPGKDRLPGRAGRTSSTSRPRSPTTPSTPTRTTRWSPHPSTAAGTPGCRP